MERFLPDWWFREPARAGAAAVIFVNSIIALLVALGVLPLDGVQVALLYLVVLNAVVFLVGNEVRKYVSPAGRDPVDPDAPEA